MSEDADDPDGDEYLPDSRGEDPARDEANLPDSRGEDVARDDEANLPGSRGGDVARDDEANLPGSRGGDVATDEETDLPERPSDSGDADDTDTLSPSGGEQDQLPEVERDPGEDSTRAASPGVDDADSASSEGTETTTGESAAPPGDDADGTDESADGDVPDRLRREVASADDEPSTAAGPDADAGTESSEESSPSDPHGGLAEFSGGDAGERPAEDFEEGDLPPRDLDRAFSILEEAFTSDAFGGQQLDQLLTVFEEALTGDGDTDPEAVMELIAMLEQLIIEPDDLTEVDVGGFLSIFEEAISGSTGVSEEDLADVFDVLEEGLRDPTSIDPEDVERFRIGVESAIMDITDPSSGGFGGLFALPGMFGEEAGQAGDGDEPVDMFRIARIAAGMTQRATGYSMETGVRTGTRMAYAAANSQSPAELLTNARAIALDELQRAGIDIGEDQQDWLDTHEDDLVHPRPVTREALQERGEALLRESAEIGVEESIHPSYPMILDELASDEARILRLLATDGPQGVVDVYERKYIPFTLTLVARNLTMLGADAGCRDKQRTPIYVENLQRLGLVAVRDTPIDDLKRYQVIQAQSHVEAARDSVKRARTRYKSIELTDFGMEFCRVCFPFPVTDETSYDTFRSAGSE